MSGEESVLDDYVAEEVAHGVDEKPMDKKVMFSGMLGNGLEWYDYAIYGQMSVIFSKIFFSKDIDPSIAVIFTLLIFAVGFIFRPLGAVLFGRIGDKYGRKKALVLAMILMAVPTGMIGLLPTYEMIGIAAPIILILIRITQGLSLGGAFGGSISYVVEHAPPSQRGRVGSVIMLSLVIGFLTGSLVAALVSNVMSPEAFESWGWRLPFFGGVLIGFVGLYIKNHGEESEVFKEAQESGVLSNSPVKDSFTKYLGKMVEAFAIYLFVTVPFYIISIYSIPYSTRHLGLPADKALLVNAIAMAAMFITIWPAAKLADKHGRKPVLMGGIILMLLLTYPAFQWMATGEFLYVVLGQASLALVLGVYLAPIPAVMVEIFPTAIRYTGMSLAYNFCAIIGGFTPAISEWLIGSTGNTQSIMYLLVGSGIASLIAVYMYQDRWKEKLAAH